MKRQWSYVIAACLVTVLAVGTALAQPGPGRMPAEPGARWAEALNLTDQQKTQIRQIMLEARKKNIDTEAKLKLARLELHEAMITDNPDAKKIDTQITEVSKLRETMMRAHIDAQLSVQKLLTPEQRKKMQEMRPFERRMRGHGHFEGMEGGGPRGSRFGDAEDLDEPLEF